MTEQTETDRLIKWALTLSEALLMPLDRVACATIANHMRAMQADINTANEKIKRLTTTNHDLRKQYGVDSYREAK